jgi:hypothetical protein
MIAKSRIVKAPIADWAVNDAMINSNLGRWLSTGGCLGG